MPADILSNLFKSDMAGLVSSGTASRILGANDLSAADYSVNLSAVSLEVGDAVSASAFVRNVDPTDTARLRLRFMNAADGGGTLVSSVESNEVDSQTFQRHTIANETIPATTLSINLMMVRGGAGAGLIEGYSGMLNRGTVSAPFLQPYRGSTITQLAPWIDMEALKLMNLEHLTRFDAFGQAPIIEEYDSGESDFYLGSGRTVPLYAHEARRVKAFLRSLGIGGRLAFRDLTQSAPGADGVRPYQANGLVDGAGQTGKSITTDGWDASVLVLSEGDWFQLLGTGQLLQADADIYSDGSGDATITTTTALRSSPADDSIVEINQPHAHARLLSLGEYEAQNNLMATPIGFHMEEDF